MKVNEQQVCSFWFTLNYNRYGYDEKSTDETPELFSLITTFVYSCVPNERIAVHVVLFERFC